MKKKLSEGILSLLLNSEEYITITTIAKRMGVSEKTVWNRLNSSKFKKLLGDHLSLEKKAGLGIRIIGDKERIIQGKETILSGDSVKKDEQLYYQNKVLMLILSRPSITIQELSEICLISKYSVTSIVTIITPTIESQGLSIEKKPNIGIQIAGEEIKIRQLLEKMILKQTPFYKDKHHKDSNFDEGIQKVLKELNMERYLDQSIRVTNDLQEELFGPFTDEGRKEIVIQILISQYRSMKNQYIKYMKEEWFETTAHYNQFMELLNKRGIELEKNDCIYLWRRCVTNRLAVQKDGEIDEGILMLSKELLNSILEITPNHEIEYLIRNLSYHIMQAVRRSEIGIKVHNPSLSKIKQKYGKFYSMVLTNVGNLEKKYNISLNEDELGFITLYICAIYETSIQQQYYKVLLVSDEGVGHTQLISMQLVNKHPNLLIHQTTTSFDLTDEYLDDCDLVISTCTLSLKTKYKYKYVRIGSFLDEEDHDKILHHILTIARHKLEHDIGKPNSQEVDFKYFKSDFKTKEEVLEHYLQIAEQFNYTAKEFAKTVFEREERASTSIGKQIAIPHGDGSYIKKQAIIYVKNDTLIDWGGDNVDVILFLILRFNGINDNRNFFINLYNIIEKTELIRNVHDVNDLKKLQQKLMKGDNHNG